MALSRENMTAIAVALKEEGLTREQVLIDLLYNSLPIENTIMISDVVQALFGEAWLTEEERAEFLEGTQSIL